VDLVAFPFYFGPTVSHLWPWHEKHYYEGEGDFLMFCDDDVHNSYDDSLNSYRMDAELIGFSSGVVLLPLSIMREYSIS